MAAYTKTLYDSTGANILYPQTLAQVVYTQDNQNVETVLNAKLTTPSGTQGQLLGFTSDNVVGAIDAQSGGTTIYIAEQKPENLTSNDMWYQIV